MHILIAPDSFKESMTAMQAAEAIEQGWRDVAGDTITFHKIPMADGEKERPNHFTMHYEVCGERFQFKTH